jgi:N-acetyl-anhydromuramyl-L-alanine amidase AmpD
MLERAYPMAQILGHRDLSPDIDGDGVVEEHEWLKDCPCFDVYTWRFNGG